MYTTPLIPKQMPTTVQVDALDTNRVPGSVEVVVRAS